MNEETMYLMFILFLLIGNFKITIRKFEFKFEGIIYMIFASLI